MEALSRPRRMRSGEAKVQSPWAVFIGQQSRCGGVALDQLDERSGWTLVYLNKS